VSKKLLLCDDELHIVCAAEIKLSRAGYTVRIARDGEEAWESILKDKPDAVVTDVQMPRCDGLELVRRIRGNAETKDLPVILLTAKGLEFDREAVIRQWNLVEVLSKPFSPRELVGLIQGIFGEVAAPTR
jgi:two-component system, OmpR family, alkaline phosphatase synthesis response regulator PhoP